MSTKKPSKKPPRPNVVEKYELCKERMLRTFITQFNKTENKQSAYKKAKDVIRTFTSSKELSNPNQILGIYAELAYFYKTFDTQQLTAEMAIGYNADFRGQILGRPSAIDVTTNPYFKDKRHRHEKIRGRLQNGWDYYIGVVDIRKTESELYPLMLPVCDDDNLGFFVLVYGDNGASSTNAFGTLSDTQYLVKYNPFKGGNESDAIEEVVSTYNYILTRPEEIIREVNDYYRMDSYDVPQETINEIETEINNHFDGIARVFRKESGLTISAIVDLQTHMFGNKDNIDDVSTQFWVHPHEYIRKNIGEPGEIMDYDIANYL